MSNHMQIIYIIFCSIVLLLLWKDMTATTVTEKQIPPTKVSQISANIGPTLKFLYCYSCGYRNLFDRYSEIIHQKYPEIHIHGGNYEPPRMKLQLATAVGTLKHISILFISLGFNVFHKFGAESPGWWNWCLENRIYSSMMIYFVGNAMEGHLISTGAFEIILNDMPVWSKLETGRAPEPPELFEIIERQLNLSSDMDMKSNFPK